MVDCGCMTTIPVHMSAMDDDGVRALINAYHASGTLPDPTRG